MYHIYANKYEEDVCDFILSKLQNDENAKMELRVGSVYRVDLYLPQGCAKLKLSGPYVIEVKREILFDTIYRLKKELEMLRDSINLRNIKMLVVSYSLNIPPKEDWPDDIEIICATELLGAEKDNAKYVTKPTWKEKRKFLIEQAKRDFTDGNNVFFLGACVSISAGLPSWNDLLERLLHEIPEDSALHNVDISTVTDKFDHSNLIMARYLRIAMNMKPSEEGLSKKIYNCLYQCNPKPSLSSSLTDAICTSITKKKVASVITYNYDDIIEKELEKRQVSAWPIYGANRVQSNQFPLYHVHGIISRDRKMNVPVLTENAYHKLYEHIYQWSNIEQLHALQRSTCFFIGLSMMDPNLRRLLEIASSNSENFSNHYSFLQDKILLKSSSEEQNIADRSVVEKMFNELGVNIIWFENFKDLPVLINIVNGSTPIKELNKL